MQASIIIAKNHIRTILGFYAPKEVAIHIAWPPVVVFALNKMISYRVAKCERV